MTPPPNLESCGRRRGRRLDKEADAPGEQELEFLKKVIKEKVPAVFMQMLCKSVMLQQLKGEKNPSSRPCVLLPSPSFKNTTDAQVISCNPQEKSLGSGDCFCSLKREGIESERGKLTCRGQSGHGAGPPEPGGLMWAVSWGE